MPSEAPIEVMEDFRDRMNDLAGAHVMAGLGITRLAGFFDSPDSPFKTANPDATLFLGSGDPNEDGFAFQSWRIVDLPEHLDDDGPIQCMLGQQWLVTVVSEWNDHYRPRFARAEGVAEQDIEDDVMGDMNLMRNDVIHHRGIGTQRNVGRCKSLDWFAEGETIFPKTAHVAEFMGHIGMLQSSRKAVDGDWEERPGAWE